MPDDTTESQPVQQNDDEDLAQEIACSIARNAREQVTCRRVNENHYRCNWWSQQDAHAYDNPGMTGMLVTTSRISRSQFLYVTKTGVDLKIRVIASDKPQRL